MRAIITPGSASGTIEVPASKSLMHRALIAAALADGESRLKGISQSEDCEATCRVIAAMGSKVEKEDKLLRVLGVPFPRAPEAPVDCGESGSTLRFAVPIFGLLDTVTSLVGQGRLLSRPQQIYADIFAEKGLYFKITDEALRFQGPLTADEYILRGDISSQFITGLLYALVLADGHSVIRILPPLESRAYLDLTVSVLKSFGIKVRWEDAYTLHVPGNQRYTPCDFTLKADWSQAAFFAVLGALSGQVGICGLDKQSLQGDRAILDFLSQMGASAIYAEGTLSWRCAPLTPLSADISNCPDLGPVLMSVCAFASGNSTITGAKRLRIKESDRIAAMQTELKKFGILIESTSDTLIIRGNGGAPLKSPAEPLHCWADHRIAMALSIAATCSDAPVTLIGAECVAKSYPHFFEDMQKLGIKVSLAD